MTHENRDWHQNVYSKNEEGLDPEYWKRVREFVIDRDHQRCQSCFKRKFKRSLSVHHIIPRREGGGDDLDNLITLCVPCHDEIEDTDIRDATEIRGYNAMEKPKRKVKMITGILQKKSAKCLNGLTPNAHLGTPVCTGVCVNLTQT